MFPPSTVPRNYDIGWIVSLAEDVVIGGHEVLQRGWERILGDSRKTVARRDEHALAGNPRVRRGGAEELDIEAGKGFMGGVASDISPAVNEEDNVRIHGVYFGLFIMEGIEVDRDALGCLEHAAVEEGVWLSRGRRDLDTDCHVRRDMRGIWVPSALLYGSGGAS